MSDTQEWLGKGRALAEARTYTPFTAKPDEYGDNIVLKSGGYSLRTGDWGDNDTIQPTPNAKYVNHAIQAFPQALDAIQAVHDLHQPVKFFGHSATWLRCTQGCSAWPCPTVEAIRDALGTDA